MRIGINGSGLLARPDLDVIVADVRSSEAAGFSSYWLAQTGLVDALQVLGLAGRVTSSIRRRSRWSRRSARITSPAPMISTSMPKAGPMSPTPTTIG